MATSIVGTAFIDIYNERNTLCKNCKTYIEQVSTYRPGLHSGSMATNIAQ